MISVIPKKTSRRFLLTLYFVSILLLILFSCVGVAVLKFYFSHLTGPKQTGLGGVLSGVKNDYILLGSSHTALSYQLPEMEKSLDARIYAISYNGLSFSLMYPILQFLSEKDLLKNVHIIIECYTGTAVIKPNLQDIRLYYHAPPALKKRIIKLLADNNQLTKANLYHLLFSSSSKDIVCSPIVNPILDKIFCHGIQTHINSPGMSQNDFATIISPVKGKGLCLDPQNINALNRIFKLLVKNKIQAVFVESPMPAVIESDPSYKQNKEELKKIISKAGFIYIDGAKNFPVNDHNMFMDAGHLSSTGRHVFTKKIIKYFTPVNASPY